MSTRLWALGPGGLLTLRAFRLGLACDRGGGACMEYVYVWLKLEWDQRVAARYPVYFAEIPKVSSKHVQ